MFLDESITVYKYYGVFAVFCCVLFFSRVKLYYIYIEKYFLPFFSFTKHLKDYKCSSRFIMAHFFEIAIWITYVISLYFAVFWFLVFLDGGLKEERKKPLRRFPFVTIVIPAYNEVRRDETGEVRNVIEQTIATTMDIDYPKDRFEVIVVNDGSTDSTAKVIRKTMKKFSGRNISFIDKKVNGGKWQAMNDALKLAKGEFFVSMDGDSLLPRNALKGMLPHFSSPKVACVMPNMKVMKPKNLMEKVQWYEYIVNMFYKKLMGKLDCIHVAPGPFSAFRTDVIRKLGGYTHGYNTEDLEITLRLQKNDYKVVQTLSVDVYTKAPDSFKVWFRQRKRWFRGATMNAVTTHRDMMFSPKSGDFGVMQMPVLVIGGLMSLIIFTTTLYYFFKPYVKYFWNLHFVDFDVMTFIRDFTPGFEPLSLNFVNVAIMLVTLFVATFILIRAHSASRESMKKYGWFSLAMFFLFYYLVMAFAWTGTLWDIIRQRKYRW